MKKSTGMLWIAALPTAHLLLCALTVVFLGTDAWDWMLVTTLDLPFIVLRSWLLPPPISDASLVIFGTIQWLCVGVAIRSVSFWLERRRRAKAIK
ncbi:MAG: hypothetical protein ACLP07_08330 [Terracidiphilus sp.]